MTNAEKIARHIANHGAEGTLIHTIPNSRFWLYCEKTQENNWRVILCDPEKTTWRLVSEQVSDEDHVDLWNRLITIGVSNHMRESVDILKKHVKVFKKLKYLKTYAKSK